MVYKLSLVQQCVTQEGDPILASMKESNKYRVLLCKILNLNLKKFSVSFKLSQKIMTNKLKCYLHDDSIKIVQFGMKFYYLILLLYNNQKNVTSDKVTNNVSKKKKSLI